MMKVDNMVADIAKFSWKIIKVWLDINYKKEKYNIYI